LELNNQSPEEGGSAEWGGGQHYDNIQQSTLKGVAVVVIKIIKAIVTIFICIKTDQ
jgi:hypothetical protein